MGYLKIVQPLMHSELSEDALTPFVKTRYQDNTIHQIISRFNDNILINMMYNGCKAVPFLPNPTSWSCWLGSKSRA